MTAPVFETVQVPRDRFKRPLIIPPDGGEPVPYTRCTTYVGVLEDTYNLSRWQQRMVAVGLAQRPDLLLRANSLGPEPVEEDQARAWKDAMAGVCDAAIEAAKGSAAATIGTALHALTERLDRGEDVGMVPEAYVGHLKAYELATAAFTPIHIERFCVNDEYRIGGTPDRVVKIDGHDKLVIADVKSGSVEYGTGKMAMQLAVYAHSSGYDPADGQRTSLGNVDLERGVIIALNAKTGKCDLKWIDLKTGWEAVSLAGAVRQWRSRRGWTTAYNQPTRVAADTEDLTVAAVVALETAIENATHPDQLTELWRKAGNVWTPEHTAMAATRKRHLLNASALDVTPVFAGRHGGKPLT